jgi:hypothetical protein
MPFIVKTLNRSHPPEEVKDVKTAIGAARAQHARAEMQRWFVELSILAKSVWRGP